MAYATHVRPGRYLSETDVERIEFLILQLATLVEFSPVNFYPSFCTDMYLDSVQDGRWSRISIVHDAECHLNGL